MTVIAWDGRTLAADKRTTDCGQPRTTTKIVRAPDGSLVATSGDSGMARALRAWWIGGADVEKYPDPDVKADLFVVTKDAEQRLYQGSARPIVLEDKTFAMGTGRDYANAAMYYGKTAREAVELACVWDTGCGNGIDTLTLD